MGGGFGGLSGRLSKGGETLGRAGAGFRNNCMCQAVIICVFSLVYRCMWQSRIGFGGAQGTFLYFFKRGGMGAGGNLGGIVGLTYV